jgi:cell pole-organizing protein PopZ
MTPAPLGGRGHEDHVPSLERFAKEARVAKDGKKKNGKKAGAKKDAAGAKLPREVAGVKVPKQLRKIGNKAVKAASNPVVSEVVAGALLAAAAALRQGKDPKTGAGGGSGAGAGTGGASGGDESVAGVKRQVSRLSDSLKLLAIDLARRTLDDIADGKRAKRRARDAAPDPAAPDSAAPASASAAPETAGSGPAGH